MPSTSKKQHNFMAAIAHSPAFAKKVGVPQSVGKDFNSADKGRKFGSGGMAKSDMKEDMKADTKQDKAIIKKAFKMHDQQEHKGEHTNLSKLKKGGMAMKKMAKGGETMGPRNVSKDVEKGSNKLTKFGESAVQKRGHTKGVNLGDSGRAVSPKTVKMAKGGKVKRYDDGGDVDTSDLEGSGVTLGQNKNIGDDTRSRAMAALESGNMDQEVTAPAKTAPSFKQKAKSAGFTSAETGGGAALMTRKDRRSEPVKAAPKAAKKSSYTPDYSVGNAMKKGGSVRGGGIEQRGKTRGKYI